MNVRPLKVVRLTAETVHLADCVETAKALLNTSPAHVIVAEGPFAGIITRLDTAAAFMVAEGDVVQIVNV